MLKCVSPETFAFALRRVCTDMCNMRNKKKQKKISTTENKNGTPLLPSSLPPLVDAHERQYFDVIQKGIYALPTCDVLPMHLSNDDE